MRIKVAKHIGFCFGVKRAVGIASSALNENKKDIYSLGPLIHNSRVVRELSRRGLKVISSFKNLRRGSVLIIRSHGLLPGLIKQAQDRRLRLIDATCPFVKKAQRICQELNAGGYSVVVAGDKLHPEVKGLIGFGANNVTVLQCMQDLKCFKFRNRKIGIVAQTTQSRQHYLKIANALIKKGLSVNAIDEVRIFDTICADTATRQSEAKRISKACDRMIVVGGKISANSRRLAQICRDRHVTTIHIEATSQIKPAWLRDARCVGVVSGASTPENTIEEVVNNVRKFK